jgi:XTP/dITP diphosphohydrolase
MEAGIRIQSSTGIADNFAETVDKRLMGRILCTNLPDIMSVPSSLIHTLQSGSRLLLATTNTGKIEELRRQLARLTISVEIVSPREFGELEVPEENGLSFAENARIKALHYAEKAGVPALADDSGLEVDALDGRPGIHSARYGPTPEGGIDRLLAELDGVDHDRRTARFRCAIALALPGEGIFAESDGAVEGRIAHERRGNGGFGYDPVFIVEQGFTGKHMAELSPEEKQAISHRGQALKSILPAVVALYKG